MQLSIFTDELKVDITEGLPILASWGLKTVDLRGWVFGSHFEGLTTEQLHELRALLDSYGMTVGCLQSSLAKVHLPDEDRQQAEARKLEAIIRTADVLDCPLVRSFFFWQPPRERQGALAVQPDQQQLVLDMFGPLARRAEQAGLHLMFENCGVTPDEVFTVLDAYNVADWGLAWDPNNSWTSDERKADEDAYIDRMIARTGCLHVKARTAVPGLLPDEELVNYPKVLTAYQAAGITGPISVETHNPDKSVTDTEMSRRTVEAVRDAWPGGRAASYGISRAWEDDPVGFVVVGLGMGNNRSRMIQDTPGTELIGVCDLNEERASSVAADLGVPYKTDLADWLDDDRVDVVYVVTETGHHASVGLQALAGGKHVIVTKPMEASLEACDRLINAAEEAGLLLAVDFSMRFEAENVSLKAAVEEGQFGRMLSGSCTLKIQRTMDYFRHNNGWRGTRRLDGGGVFSNQSIHLIDQIAFNLGAPAKVRANIWTQTHDIEAEDAGSATWLYDDGAVITFSATSSYPHKTWYSHYELEGTEGAFTTSAGGPYEKPFTRWFFGGNWRNSPPQLVQPPWLNSADNMAAAIRSGAALVCSGQDGRQTQAILDAMYRSAYEADGGWVEVERESAAELVMA